ncbi:4Fe-4S binding protein [Crocinitomix catalasitica]|uniref:4Fe-4S binding protein n=1 Tax=Crocinitomix catalasitica TaxID=184607 RepID=UPI000489358C|nr:4Fe-4S dicluster domain-containing protein [Crocinitomix catalasitica]
MQKVKYFGMGLFLLALLIFTSLPFLGTVQLTEKVMIEQLNEQELGNLQTRLNESLVGKEFSNSISFSNAFEDIFNEINEELKAKEDWDNVMWTPVKDISLKLVRSSTIGPPVDNKWLLLFLTFGLGIIGSLIYILSDLKLKGPPGIKNDGIYHDSATNRGWIGILTGVWLVTFYILLYFNPSTIANMIAIADPLKQLFIPTEQASKWFLYGLLYTTSMTVMGIRMIIKYRHNRYQIVRTITVVLFQIIFAFLLVEILPMFDLPGKDLKNAWPLDYYFLFEWNVQNLFDSGNFGKFIFVWGIVLSIIIVPTMVYFFGKRWYCSWVCGCGGLAETLGDPYRHLSNKKMWTWKMERWMIHGVLVFAIIMTIFTGYLTYNVFNNPEMDGKEMLFGISAYDVRSWYGFLIGSIFAGVIGTGFYPILGSRSWCRFGCPLAAYMGIVQRFKSRFRITTNGGQCISCGNCSTYCEQGIDVRAYAQKGQNIVRSSCVGCGVCSAVCPRGVLKLENGPEEGRFGNEGPIVLGNNGFKLNQ